MVANPVASSRTSVEFPVGTEIISDYCFYSNRTLTDLDIPASVKEIGNYAFYRCSNLKNIRIGDGVKVIGKNAFQLIYGCAFSLGRGVERIESGAFLYCGQSSKEASMETLVLPGTVRYLGPAAFGWNPFKKIVFEEGIQVVDSGTFRGMANLETIVFPSSLRKIGATAFQRCDKLKNINLPSGLDSIGNNAFEEADFTSFNIPAGLSFLGKEVFKDCVNLTAINVDAANRYYASRDGVLFDKAISTLRHYPCARPDTAYTVPESVIALESYAFMNVTKLQNVTLPKHLKSFGIGTFYYCRALKSMRLPIGVKVLPRRTFTGCSALTNLYVDNKVPPTCYTDNGILEFFPITFFNSGTLYVPVGSKQAYESAPVWKDFEHIIESSILTGVTNPGADKGELKIETADGHITISAAEGTHIRVHAVSGIKIWEGTAPTPIPELPNGIYIVHVGSTSAKVRL